MFDLKICPTFFKTAQNKFKKTMHSHPNRQEFFFQCFFNNKKEEFKQAMIEYSVSDKDSRKQRIRYKNNDTFVQTVDPLTKDEINEINKAIELLFDLIPFDNFFVEKSYCIIEGVTDHLKSNGSVLIGEYVRNNDPQFLNMPNFLGESYIQRWIECYESDSFDARLIKFQNQKYKTEVIQYCQKYRDTIFMKEWIKENKRLFYV